MPTEIISGYVNIERRNSDNSINVIININNADYIFDWLSD